MIIELDDKIDIEIITQQSVKINTDKISIDIRIDNGSSVIATVSFIDGSGMTMQLVLWDETTTPTYIEIGQWNDEQSINRIKELLINK